MRRNPALCLGRETCGEEVGLGPRHCALVVGGPSPHVSHHQEIPLVVGIGEEGAWGSSGRGGEQAGRLHRRHGNLVSDLVECLLPSRTARLSIIQFCHMPSTPRPCGRQRGRDSSIGAESTKGKGISPESKPETKLGTAHIYFDRAGRKLEPKTTTVGIQRRGAWGAYGVAFASVSTAGRAFVVPLAVVVATDLGKFVVTMSILAALGLQMVQSEGNLGTIRSGKMGAIATSEGLGAGFVCRCETS